MRILFYFFLLNLIGCSTLERTYEINAHFKEPVEAKEDSTWNNRNHDRLKLNVDEVLLSLTLSNSQSFIMFGPPLIPLIPTWGKTGLGLDLTIESKNEKTTFTQEKSYVSTNAEPMIKRFGKVSQASRAESHPSYQTEEYGVYTIDQTGPISFLPEKNGTIFIRIGFNTPENTDTFYLILDGIQIGSKTLHPIKIEITRSPKWKYFPMNGTR